MMSEIVKPEDLFALRSLAQPVSDGQRVYYLESHLDQQRNRNQSSIFSISLATGDDRRRWSPEGMTVSQLTLSPDHRYLAFTGQVGDHTQLFRVDLTGGAPVQLTKGDRDIDTPVWAADGHVLYFQTVVGEPEPTEFPQPQVVTRLWYQENGVGILPQGLTYQCLRYDCETGDQSVVLEQSSDFQVMAANAQGLVYGRKRLPNDDQDFSEGVYWHSFDGDSDRLLNAAIPQGTFDSALLSPDGTHVAMWGLDNHIMDVAQAHAWVVDLATGDLTDVTAPRDVEVGDKLTNDSQRGQSGQSVAWLDSATLLTLENVAGRVSLIRQTVTGGRVTPLLDGDRGITDFSVVDGHTIVFTETTMTSVSRLKVLDLTTMTERELVNPNAQYEATHALVAGQPFTFQTADFPVSGWYFPPVTPRAQHPAILYIHGGPEVNYGYGFYHEFQYLVGQGYGVIAIDPRGSTGYGQAFSAAVIGHYGEGDFADLMAGTDAALKLDPTIDPQQLCVTGGSYGGFMTNWIETHTTRFAAAVTQRSISDWVSFYGTSDIGYFFTKWEMNLDMTDETALWELSPLAHVKNASTPILILHGESDRRSPTTQGMAFYMGLKEAGVETQLVLFPESTHELSRSGLPNLRIERLKQINRWFKDHLPQEEF